MRFAFENISYVFQSILKFSLWAHISLFISCLFSNSEQLVQLAHVNVPIFLCIFVVVILIHTDSYVDSRFLVLVLA